MTAMPPRFVSALVLAVLLLALGATAAPVIENPAEPPIRETLTLREAWRAGGEDDADVLLGQVGVAVAGSAGEVYALDSQLAHVLVFARDGAYERTLGREGDGPGEFRQPVGMYLPGDGTLAVQQAFPGRITYLGLDDGLPRDTWNLGNNNPQAGGFAFMETARQRGGTFAISAASTSLDQTSRDMRNTNYLAIVDRDGGELARLSEVSTSRSMMGFTVDELADHNPGDRELWDLAPDGAVYLTPRFDAYEIAVHGPDGTLRRTIARPHEARVRTDAEKDEIRGSMRININGQEPDIEWKVQDRAHCIDRLQVQDDGTLWVVDSHGRDRWQDEGTVVYGVFGPDGRLQREVTVTVPEGGEGDRLILLRDGRFMLVKGMESLSISISAGDSENINVSDEELGDTLLELVCFEVAR